MNRDTLFRLAIELDFPSFKKLCQSNPLYAQICREERFQQLIKTRYQEYLLNRKIDQVYNILNRFQTSKYTLIEPGGPNNRQINHQIVFGHYRGYFQIQEGLSLLLPPDQSILIKIFGLNDTRISSEIYDNNKFISALTVTPKEIKDILEYIITQTKFDISKLENDQLKRIRISSTP